MEVREVIFPMQKLKILILVFFFPLTAYAGLEGLGDIKLSQYSLERFEKYLSDDVKNKKLGANQRGTGLVFSISADGQHSGFYYCFQGRSCTPDEVKVKNHCETTAKKKGVNVKCNTFAINRKIVWNNVNKVVPKNISVKEFINKLGPNSGITISDAKPPSDLDGEQKKQLKSLLDAGIMTKKEYEEALKQIK